MPFPGRGLVESSTRSLIATRSVVERACWVKVAKTGRPWSRAGRPRSPRRLPGVAPSELLAVPGPAHPASPPRAESTAPGPCPTVPPPTVLAAVLHPAPAPPLGGAADVERPLVAVATPHRFALEPLRPASPPEPTTPPTRGPPFGPLRQPSLVPVAPPSPSFRLVAVPLEILAVPPLRASPSAGRTAAAPRAGPPMRSRHDSLPVPE